MNQGSDNMEHVPVMPSEVLEWLDLKSRNVIVDGTLGLGGHSEFILNSPDFKGRVFGIDRDEKHLQFARERLAKFGGRFRGVHSVFSEIDSYVDQFDGVLLDLGVASPHLDDFERGFSYREDGVLDMRMGRSKGKTACEVLMTYTEEELADVFFHYGEERLGRKIARWIVEDREKGVEFKKTGELADLVCRAYRTKYSGGSKSHPATKVFQALRIEVNDELRELETVLNKVAERIDEGGRIVVISYHSLEDRIVKTFFDKHGSCEECRGKKSKYPNFKSQITKVCACRLRALTKKPLTATKDEVEKNPRARAAKMRVAAVLN